MAESVIPVDLLNPGQVFACIGIMELADVLQGSSAAAFDWSSGSTVRFCVSAAGAESPVERIMRFLDEAEVITRVPAQSPNINLWKSSWGTTPIVDAPSDPFPFPDPSSPATLPALLRDTSGNEIMLEYWGDGTQRDNVKFWAGAAGFPGAAIARNALALARRSFRQHCEQIQKCANNPFALSADQSNSFRFDWRRDYIPIQEGFSPNEHSDIQMVGYPLVEILAAIGMNHARPCRVTKLEYRYGVIGNDSNALLCPVFHRAALGAKHSPVPGMLFRRFAMYLDWPGKKGQARCITKVTEETFDQ